MKRICKFAFVSGAALLAAASAFAQNAPERLLPRQPALRRSQIHTISRSPA
jgi:hypothetical protein